MQSSSTKATLGNLSLAGQSGAARDLVVKLHDRPRVAARDVHHRLIGLHLAVPWEIRCARRQIARIISFPRRLERARVARDYPCYGV